MPLPKSSKTLLVLAASVYQLDVIRTARALGYRVITTDNVPSNPGHALADRCYGVDTTDPAGVLAIARAERIDGVIAACTDVAVPTAAYVSEQLGLTAPSLRAARTLCNKVAFRAFLDARGFPAPDSFPISPSTLPSPADFSGAWVVKPDRSSGSKGVAIVRSYAELQAHLPAMLAFSPDQCGICERFIDGHQGTCEGVLVDGTLALLCLMDRRTVAPPHTTTAGQHVPTRLPAHLQDRLCAHLQRLWAALGVSNGPFDCDFVATDDEVYLLEASPRIGGNGIAALLRAAWDFDIIAYAVRAACGDAVEIPANPPVRPTAGILFGAETAGRLAYDVAELARLHDEPWVRELTMDYPPGTPVQPFINGRHRAGFALLHGEDRDALDARVAECRARLRVRAE